MTINEVKELLKSDCLKDAVLIGNEEERENYYPAIIDIDCTKAIVTYDYDELVKCFAKFVMDSDDETAIEVAREWVDYNVIRSLPYYGEHAPKIYQKDWNFDEE